MRHYTKQVELDIENYTKTGKLPQAWDVIIRPERDGGYWDWVYTCHGGVEPQELRQDEIPEHDLSRLYEGNKFRQRATEWLHENGPELFTVRELLVYSLCFVEGKTERAAAYEMGISAPRVFELKASIRKKVKKAIEGALANS
jgi:predicted DNA-binding protein (UPF0251 family)